MVVSGREASETKNFVYRIVIEANMLASMRVNWRGKYMIHG